MSTVEAENTMRALQGRQPLNSMEDMVKHMKHYVETYEIHASDSPQLFLADMLYGIGTSMSPEYEFAGGYIAFEEYITEWMIARKVKVES